MASGLFCRVACGFASAFKRALGASPLPFREPHLFVPVTGEIFIELVPIHLRESNRYRLLATFQVPGKVKLRRTMALL